MRTGTLLAVAAAIAVASLGGVAAIAPPPPPTDAEVLDTYIEANAQSFSVHRDAAAASIVRDGYSATPGIQTLASGGTNHDWAKLVLLSGGWPMTESNVAVITRWMRQENGPDNWYNRNNPLNNGYGSGGGGGTGSYSSLVVAAQKAAEGLNRFGFYSEIVAGFAASAPTDVIENAIWNSPWASGHYAYGGHWSSAPVPEVKAPASSW